MNAYLTATGPGGAASVAFAICDDCGRVEQRDATAALVDLTSALSIDGFVPTRPVIEMHGRCGDCDSGARP